MPIPAILAFLAILAILAIFAFQTILAFSAISVDFSVFSDFSDFSISRQQHSPALTSTTHHQQQQSPAAALSKGQSAGSAAARLSRACASTVFCSPPRGPAALGYRNVCQHNILGPEGPDASSSRSENLRYRRTKQYSHALTGIRVKVVFLYVPPAPPLQE